MDNSNQGYKDEEKDTVIARRRNHKGNCLAAFCILMAGLIALASCTNPALSIMFQEISGLPGAEHQPIVSTSGLESGVYAEQDVYQEPEAGCGSGTMMGPGGGGWIPAMAIASSPPGSVYVACDVGGVYKSTNDGESWVIKNKGLANYDIQTMAVDPHNPDVIYVGTLGGIFKSTDGGENWRVKRNGFPETEKWSISAPVSALAIDPDNPDIVYVGIGHLGQCNSFAESHGKGTIYKSINGGDNWLVVNTGSSAINTSAVIHSIAIDPTNTSTLYTGTDKGLYKSTDGGTNWTAKNDGLPVYSGETTPNIRRVIVNPQNPSILYVTVQTKPNTEPWQGGVYKSTDGGESWIAKCNGLVKNTGGAGDHEMVTSNYRDIVIDPQDPEILYVGDYSWGNSGIYKTTGGGDNWVHTTTLTGSGKNMDVGWIDYCGLSVDALAIDPSDPERLYFIGSVNLYKTNDGGDTWSQAYTKETESGTCQSIGFETTCIWDIAVDESNPDNIYVGYMDIGFLKSTDGGTSFKRTEILNPWGGNTFSIAIDPDSPNIIYAGAGQFTHTNTGRVVRSTDYGDSFTIIGSPDTGLPDAMAHSIAIDPTTPVDSRTLYVASRDHGVYKSVDGGQSWVSINNGIGANLYVHRLVIDPNDPDILYVGIRATTGQSIGDYGGIYKTTDGGESWTKANKNIELPDVWALVMDPSDSSTLYAGTGQHYTQPSGPMHLGGVYKSVDGGENWQAVLVDDPPLSIFNIGSLAISPVNPDLIVAGAFDFPYHDVCPGEGIFRSTDGGETWKVMNEYLTLWCIDALAAHPTNPDIVYVATHGNSLFRVVMPWAEVPVGGKPGDANDDGVVDVLDMTKVARVILLLDEETPEADANEDGTINVIDMSKIARIILGLDAPMGAEVTFYDKGFLVERPNLRNFPPVLCVRGTPYEMGYQHGYLMRDYIVDHYSSILTWIYSEMGGWESDGVTIPTPEQWETGRELAVSAYYNLFDELVQEEVPQLYQEALGLAAGLEARYQSEGRECPITLGDVLYLNFWGIEGSDQGCSNFAAWGAATKNGETIHAQNLDWYSYGVHKDISVKIASPDDGNAFLSVFGPGIVLGLGGMNEQGVTSSTLKSDSANVSPTTQISLSMSRRLALQFADNIQDAYEMLEQYKGATGGISSGNNLLIIDGIGDGAPNGAVIELSGTEIAIRYEDPGFLPDVIWATNHYNCYPGWQGYEGYNMVPGQMDFWGIPWEQADTVIEWQTVLQELDYICYSWARYGRYRELISENHGSIDAFKAMEFQSDTTILYYNGLTCNPPVEVIAPECVQMYGFVRPITRQMLLSIFSSIYVPSDGVTWVAVGAKPAQIGTYWPVSLTQYLQALRDFSFENLIPDSDGDGMPDDWELAYRLDPNIPTDAAIDTDGDGATNLEEYMNGTDPTSTVEYEDAPECN